MNAYIILMSSYIIPMNSYIVRMNSYIIPSPTPPEVSHEEVLSIFSSFSHHPSHIINLLITRRCLVYHHNPSSLAFLTPALPALRRLGRERRLISAKANERDTQISTPSV